MALGRIGDRAATPLLLPLLHDPDTAVRAEAAFALGELGDTAATRGLAALADAFAPVAGGAWESEVVTALAKIGSQDADLAVERLLERHPPTDSGADPATAAALLEAWRLGSRSAVAPRLTAYVASRGAEWRRHAAYSAARLRLADAAGALLQAATDPDLLTRSYALRALTAELADSAGMDRQAFVGRLRESVDDPSAQARINALRALATYRDSALAALAAPLLADRDPNVPVQAAATVGSLGGSRAAALLAERFTTGGTFALRRAALLGLAQASPPAALNAGMGWRAARDWRLRGAYAEMLGVVGSAAARQELVRLLDDADARVVSGALAALGQAAPPGDSLLLAAAQERLGHRDVMVRAAAIALLARRRDATLVPDFVAAFRRAETEEMNDARLAAVHALAEVARQGGAAQRAEVERAFLATVPRSGDYLVRRTVAERFGAEAARRYWGETYPVLTGRNAEDYREVARRYILRPKGAGPMRMTIETERGRMVVDLYPYEAPLTVDNLIRLVDRGYFDDLRWHRVVPNFVIQDGDPRGDGSGGPGTVIRDEINRRRYDRGAVGMALSGPDTGGSQYFITHSPQPHLDGGYTVFGHVVAGFDVLDRIVQGDRIRRIIR